MAWNEVFYFPFKKFPYKLDLHGLSDWQLGSRSCCLWKIENHIDDILESAKHVDTGIVFAGDIEDEDRPSTRKIRREIAADREEVVARDAEKHMAWIDKAVMPMLLRLHVGTKYGILGGVAGHHWTQLSPALNSVQYIFHQLKAKTGKPCIYLGEMSSWLDFRFSCESNSQDRSTRWVGFLQHGEGGGQTKSATISKLERAGQAFEADFHIRAHDCQLLATKTDVLYPKLTEQGAEPIIMSKTRGMLNLGAATMGYEVGKVGTSYVENSMMRPTTIGWGTYHFTVRRASTYEDRNHNTKIEMRIEI